MRGRNKKATAPVVFLRGLDYGPGMQFREFLDGLPHGGLKKFAVLVDVAPQSIDRYGRGHIPKPEVMERIARATGYLVMPNDWFPELMESARGIGLKP